MARYSFPMGRTEAGFPGEVWEPLRFVDYDEEHGALEVAFTVPSSAPHDVLLPVARPGSAYAVTVGGGARVVTRELEPGAGRVGVDRLTGRARFHGSDAGGAAMVALVPLRTMIVADWLERVQAEVKATQEALGSATVYRSFTIVGSAVTPAGQHSHARVFPAEAGWQVLRASIYAPLDQQGGAPMGPTVIELANNADYNDPVELKIAQSANLADLALVPPLELSDYLYVRVGSGGGHQNLHIEMEIKR